LDRRNLMLGAVAASVVKTALAQEAYPNRAITIINPFPPGGASDVVTRPLAAVLEPIVHNPVVIDTKPGAAGQVGAQVAAHAKPDGYTLLSHITSVSGFAEVDRLFGRQPKFTNADFIPLAAPLAGALSGDAALKMLEFVGEPRMNRIGTSPTFSTRAFIRVILISEGWKTESEQRSAI
jgi:Tripartite tricarboxylate transporter family receptor